MGTSSTQTWLVVLPIMGGVVAGGLGAVIPGLSPVVLGAVGLGAGAGMGVLLVYLDASGGPDSGPDPGPTQQRSTPTVTNARLGVVVTDAVTGDPVRAPVEVTAEQSFVDERQQVVTEEGRCTFELRTLTWTVSVNHDGRTATTEADVGETETVELTLPARRVRLAVEDRNGDPLADASVSCTAAPVDASRVATDAGANAGVHAFEVPAATRRAAFVVEHEDFETERVEVLVDESVTEATVTLERPDSHQAVDESTGGADDREAAPTEPEPEVDAPLKASHAGGNSPAASPGRDGTTDEATSGSASASPEAPNGPETASGDGGETTAGDETGTASGDEAGATPEDGPDRTPIPEVGVTGIDRHTPEYSPNPARADLNADVIESVGEETVVSETEYATVWRVEVGDRTIAVKGPGPDGTGTDVVSETVERADEWRDIDDHPNVATLLDADVDPHPYLAVEYAEGTLADADLPFDQTVALWHATRLADAVAEAHRNRVFHLNMKPSNVLLQQVERTAWPVAKLTDWDLPRLLDLPNPIFKPLNGEYAAPEQVRPDEFDGVDERTDIYQLGVLTYELLTGESPMNGSHAVDRSLPESEDDLSDAETIPRVTAQDPDLAKDLDHILRTATEIRKEDRYSSADDLRDALLLVATSVAGAF